MLHPEHLPWKPWIPWKSWGTNFGVFKVSKILRNSFQGIQDFQGMLWGNVHRWFLWILSNPLCYISGPYIVHGVICLCSVLCHIIICRGMKTECIKKTDSLWQRTFNLTLIPFCWVCAHPQTILRLFLFRNKTWSAKDTLQLFTMMISLKHCKKTSKVRALAGSKKPN